MARKYKRDKLGRFAAKGGGGKMGKSAKNQKARDKYKKSQRKVREAEEAKRIAAGSKGGKKAAAFAGRGVGGAKSGLTRVSKGLQGGKSRQGSFKQMSKSAKKTKSAPKKSAAAAKQAYVRKQSSKVLGGGKITKSQQRYIRSQQGEKMRREETRGKGSKAKRRARRK